MILPSYSLLPILLACCILGAAEAFVMPGGGAGKTAGLRRDVLEVSSCRHGRHSSSVSAIGPLFMNKKKKSKSKGGGKSKSGGGGGGKGFGAAPVAALQSLVTPGTFQYAGTVVPGVQSPQRTVTDSQIMKPDYADDGVPKNRPQMLPWVIEQKTPEEIAKMRAAGRVAREVLDIAGRMVAPGVTTDAIDAVVHEETLKRGAYPSPLNYHGFPKSCCTSVNEGEKDFYSAAEGNTYEQVMICNMLRWHSFADL